MSLDESEFCLNRENKKICGVCAGLADYFEVSAFWVRAAFVFGAFTWAPTILAYFILYFVMSKHKAKPKDLMNDLGETSLAQKIKNFDYKKSLFKNKRKGKIQGVCYGVAKYLDINPFWIRLAAAVSLMFGPLAIIIYIFLAIVLDEEPREFEVFGMRVDDLKEKVKQGAKNIYGAGSDDGPQYKSYGRSYSTNPGSDLKDVNEVFEGLEKKLRRIEATVTSKKFKLHSEFKRMSTQ